MPIFPESKYHSFLKNTSMRNYMPQVIIIEPENFSPFVRNVSSFHLADIRYYFNSMTVCQLLTVQSGMRSQIHLFVTDAPLKFAWEQLCLFGNPISPPQWRHLKMKKKRIFQAVKSKITIPNSQTVTVNSFRQCLEFCLEWSGPRCWSPVNYFRPLRPNSTKPKTAKLARHNLSTQWLKLSPNALMTTYNPKISSRGVT